MFINIETMNKMHTIQLAIFKKVVDVCRQLNLTYFLVHGSLLGAVKTGKFFPLDDDIDIAMPRTDYEIFIKEGSKIIGSQYFIQSNKTDKQYPLSFAKVRDKNTTYIADLFRNLKINHGVFIDVFPIDFYDKKKELSFSKKILETRISAIYYRESVSIKNKIKKAVAKILYPSWDKAVEKREKINSIIKNSDYITITGGKGKEKGIPYEWFSQPKTANFEGIECLIPKGYKEYLTQIYGDYLNTTLLEAKDHTEKEVEINAIVVDLNKPFTEYIDCKL